MDSSLSTVQAIKLEQLTNIKIAGYDEHLVRHTNSILANMYTEYLQQDVVKSFRKFVKLNNNDLYTFYMTSPSRSYVRHLLEAITYVTEGGIWRKNAKSI